MRIVPISEIPSLENGETVPSVRGKIISIYKAQSGTNSKGQWSLQNMALKDGTGEIQIKLQDRPEIPVDWKGREIEIQCNQGDKGLTGIKAKDDTYREKTSRILSVTPSAHVIFTESGAQSPAPAAMQAKQTQQTTPAPTTPAPLPPTENGGAVGELKRSLNRMANLYLHCMEAGNYVRASWEEAHKVDMTPDQFQACVSSLYIQASRDMLHGNLPVGKFK